MTTLIAHTPSGLEVIFAVSPNWSGGQYLTAEIPARKISGQVNGRPEAIPARDGATYKMAIGTAYVGFADSEAAKISAWIDDAKAEIAATPEAIRRRLEGDRRDLCLKIQGGHEDARIANERAWERGDESNAFRSFNDSDLRAKLAEFDCQHPEIIEAIVAENAEAHRRFLAAD